MLNGVGAVKRIPMIGTPITETRMIHVNPPPPCGAKIQVAPPLPPSTQIQTGEMPPFETQTGGACRPVPRRLPRPP